MSSVYVRDQFKQFLADNSDETVIDLTSEYSTVGDMVESAGISQNDDWVGLQFVGADESPITIGSSNTKGKYREFGAVYIHTVGLAKLGGSGSILNRAEVLRDLFRGQKFGTVKIDAVSPPNTESGAALRFEDGYTTASFIISYERDLDL